MFPINLEPPPRPRRWSPSVTAQLLPAILALGLPACQSDSASASASSTTNTLPLASPTVVTSEPEIAFGDWSFQGDHGQLIRTTHYRLHTTARNSILLDRLPGFVEAALAQYRNGLVPLPAPRDPLDTYLFDSRLQWEAYTRQVMGDRADAYLRIARGGFSTGGQAVLYDIGVYDTLSIAAHEGWHQYTQQTFRESLPIWMEEGIAAFMEGHRFDGREALFRPWANTERYDQLRRDASRGNLLPLDRLMSSHPEQLLARSNRAALTFYAQVWALMHFLNEGDDGKYREGFHAMIHDAAVGGLRARLRASLRARGQDGPAATLASASGPALFLAYFPGENLDDVNAQYQEFIRKLIARGGRDRILMGENPLVSQ